MKPGQGSQTAVLVAVGRAIAHDAALVPEFSDPTANQLQPEKSGSARAACFAIVWRCGDLEKWTREAPGTAPAYRGHGGSTHLGPSKPRTFAHTRRDLDRETRTGLGGSEMTRAEAEKQADAARAALLSDIQELKQAGQELVTKAESKVPLLIGGAVGVLALGALIAFRPTRKLLAKTASVAALSAIGILTRRYVTQALDKALPAPEDAALPPAKL